MVKLLKNHKVLSTLFVGIDVGSMDNEACAIDFDTNRYLEFSVKNNQPGAVAFTEKLVGFLKSNGQFSSVVIAMESEAILNKYQLTLKYAII